MRKIIFLLICMFVGLSCFATNDANRIILNDGLTESDFCSDLELDVLKELNIARTNPKLYASFIADTLQYYQGSYLCYPGEIRLITKEGTAVVKQAIAFLQKQTPLNPFKLSKGMTLAAKDHVKDQSASGATGHYGRDKSSPFDRLNRYGKWNITSGENIDYGNNKARRIVMSLIIDDGVSSRGHRHNIFNKDFNIVGIGCGTHKGYGYMCVMDFAGSYSEKVR